MHQTHAHIRMVCANHSTCRRAVPREAFRATHDHVAMQTPPSVATACMLASTYERRRRTLRMHTRRMQRGAAEDHAGATMQRPIMQRPQDMQRERHCDARTNQFLSTSRTVPRDRRECRAPCRPSHSPPLLLLRCCLPLSAGDSRMHTRRLREPPTPARAQQ